MINQGHMQPLFLRAPRSTDADRRGGHAGDWVHLDQDKSSTSRSDLIILLPLLAFVFASLPVVAAGAMTVVSAAGPRLSSDGSAS